MNNNKITPMVFNGNETTPTLIQTFARNNMYELLYDKMSEIFGEENVSKVLTGAVEDRLKKEIAVVVGNVRDDDGEHELCVTLKVTGKEYKDRRTKTFVNDLLNEKIKRFDRQALSKKYNEHQKKLALARQYRAEKQLNEIMESITTNTNIDKSSMINMLENCIEKLK